MNQIISLDSQTLISSDDPFIYYGELVSRFIATRESEKTRETYLTGLNDYRDLCLHLGRDPFKADSIIIYNEEIHSRLKPNGNKLADDTIITRLRTIKAFFTWLYTFDLTPLKPKQIKELITIPQGKQLSPRDILTEEEVSRLLSHVGNEIESLILRVMLDSGLRLAELLNLRGRDIYTDDNKCFIFVSKGKGSKSRDIPISEDLYNQLTEYASKRGIDILKDDKILWPNLYPRKVQRMVTKAIHKAGIKKNITPHSLRHTTANQLRKNGYSLDYIKEFLGHSKIDTTLIYTRPGTMLREYHAPKFAWHVPVA